MSFGQKAFIYDSGRVLINPAVKELQQDQIAVLNRILASTQHDIFGNQVTVERRNWMEVPFDDPSYADFIDEDSQHGGTAQALGRTAISSGTNQNGFCVVTSKDAVRYRSSQEVGVGFTFDFPTGPVAGTHQRIGPVAGDQLWDNAVFVGYEGADFGIRYYRNGVEQLFVPLSEISNKLGYTLDPAKVQIARVVFGLYGHRGWRFEVCTPSGEFVSVAEYNGVNQDDAPVFESDFTINVAAEVRKNQPGISDDLIIRTSCWAGWTTSGAKRLSDPFTPRTLVTPGQTVITGETSAGGGGFVNVKVTPSGQLTSDALTNAELRAAPVAVENLAQLVPEQYDDIELGYTGLDLTTVTYRSGGGVVATLTLTYTLGQLTRVVRS